MRARHAYAYAHVHAHSAGLGFTRKCLTYEPLASRARERERDCMNRNVSPDLATRRSTDWILGVSWIIAKVKSSARHAVAAQRRPMINDHSTAYGSALRDALPLAIGPRSSSRRRLATGLLRHHEFRSINFCVFALPPCTAVN